MIEQAEGTLTTCSNGLRSYYQPCASSAVSHLCVMIGAGSSDETTDEWGLAHFMEHMLFKGTKTRSGARIIRELEKTGGDLNAFTGREHTCLHASFLNEELPTAMALLSDLIFSARFDAREILKEQAVVADEIDSYRDSPEECIVDDFEELLKPGHSFFRNILGSKASVASFDFSSLDRWRRAHFVMPRMVIGLSSSTGFESWQRLVEKYFSTSSVSVATLSGTADNRLENPLNNPLIGYTPFHQTINRETSQAHHLTGGPAPSVNDPLFAAVLLLNNYLGAGMSSVLNMEIREKKGICYTIESSYCAYSYTGTFGIYFGTDPRKQARCQKLIHAELAKLTASPLPATDLAKAKTRFKGQIALAEEARCSVLISACKSILDRGKTESLVALFGRIDALSKEQVHSAACLVFAPENLSSLLIEPAP